MVRRAVALLVLLASACSLAPKLEMPVSPAPAAYALSEGVEGNGAVLGWKEMFGDPRLQQLIALALDNSRDLRVAILNVEAARAQFKVQRSERLPNIGANVGYQRQRTPAEVATAGFGDSFGGLGGVTGFEYGVFSAQALLTTFELDVFGRLKSLSEAAYQSYLASDAGRRAAQITLVGAVVDAYLAERLAEEQLALSEKALADWRASLAITERLHAAHQTSGADVAQAESLVHQAEADIEERRRALEQAHNAIALVVGTELPKDLPPALGLMQQPIITQLPAGLPSELLTNRPDIRQAEFELVAANANIGAARAAFFPRLSLTAMFGTSSVEASGLFSGANRQWQFSPQISQPIFMGGRLKGELQLAKVRKSVAIANYEKSIQTAFREVADGLAGRATFARQVSAQTAVADTSNRRLALTTMRYEAGLDSRLELLDAQRSSYTASQALLSVRAQELSTAASLYRSLGGGLVASIDGPPVH